MIHLIHWFICRSRLGRNDYASNLNVPTEAYYSRTWSWSIAFAQRLRQRLRHRCLCRNSYLRQHRRKQPRCDKWDLHVYVYIYIYICICKYKIYKIYEFIYQIYKIKKWLMEDWYIINIICIFRCVGLSGNVLLYCWCVLYYKLRVLMRLSDALSFSVYMNIFPEFYLFFENVQKCEQLSYDFLSTMYIYWYFRRETFMVFRRKYYWYFRR